MIFKTFDSKIDKWTSKIGVFGKSFNELGTAVNNAFKSVIDNLDNFDEDVGFGKSLKNNLFPKKEDIKSLEIAVPELIDTKKANEYIDIMKQIDSGTHDVFKTYQEWYDSLADGEKWIAKHGQETKGQIRNLEGVTQANQQARASAIAHNEAIQSQTFSAKAGAIALKALSIAGNMIAMWAISKVISGLYELSQVSKNVAESAKELGDSFKNTSSDIDSYKTKIAELHKTINDSNSSIEDVTNARKSLLSIQDELIDKFGTEETVINNVTTAINGQTQALNELSKAKWQETKNEFNDAGFWGGIANWFEGYEDNIDRMITQMEHKREILSFSYNDFDSANFDELKQLLKNRGWNYQRTLGGFVKEGSLKEIYSEILEIQNLANNIEVPDYFLKDLIKDANSAKKTIDDYGDMWDTYILQEKIFANDDLADSWHEVTKAYSEYEKAFASGDQNAIEKSIAGFSDLMKSILENPDIEESVKEYFSDMYPVLQAEVEKWEFHTQILPEYDTHALNGKNKADILDMLQEDGLQSGEQTFTSILNLASKYGIVTGNNTEKINQLLDLLVEWGILQESINKGAGEYSDTFSRLSISDTIDQLNTRLKPAMDSLQSAYEDLLNDDGNFNLNSVDILSTCDTIKSKLDELNNIEGISVDYSAFEDFVRVLRDSESTEQDVEIVMNSLASSITKAALSGTEDFETMKAALEDLGVVNSEMVAFDALIGNTKALKESGLDLQAATYDEIEAFTEGIISAENYGQACNLLKIQKILCAENPLDTSGDIMNLYLLANAAGIATDAITQLMTLNATYESASAEGNTAAALAAKGMMEVVKQNIKNQFAHLGGEVDFRTIGGGKSSAKSAGSDTGKSYKEGLKEELSDLNSVISGITKSIDGQIDVIDEQKDTALDAIEAQIEALEEERDARLAVIDAQKAQLEEEIESIDKKIKSKQDEIDAINDAAEARKREIDLQKAQYNLERMQNQRTILQYSQEKGMHYVADEQGIRDAREDVDDARRQIEIADIEKEIDLLESQKDLLNEQIDLLDKQADKINEFYDAQIKTLEKQKEETEKYFESLTKALEDSKSKYTELTEIADKAELSAKLAQLGIDEAALLSGSEEEFQKLKNAYMDTVFQLNEGNTQVLSKLQELSGYSGTAPALLSDSNSALDTMNGKLDLSNQSVGTVNSSLGAAAAIAGEIASNVGTLETNLGIVNTFLTDEQTAFSNLKATIDEVITALNLKIQAIQAAQSAAGIATTTEIAYFLLLRDKIDEIKQSIAGINDAIIIIDRQPIDHLADSFQHLYEQILLVSTTLGSGMEGQGAGLAGNIISAMQALNKISFEEGIIAQLTNLKTAIDAVTNAISGGGDTSGGETQGGSGATTGGNPGGKDSGGTGNGKSLTGAITDIGTTTSEVIGEPEAEGDGTVIGAFGALETAVDDVTTAIGSGDSEDNEAKGADGEDDNSLIDSITGLGDTTEDILGEPGGDGVIGRFEQFKEPIAAADEHVRSIYKGLTDIDGTEAECTIKVHIETDGSTNFTGAGQVLGSMNLESADYAATLNQNTTYDPNQDHSVFGTLYKAWNTHYGSNNQGAETIAKTLSRHLVMEHSQQMTKEITRISNSNHAANNGRDNRPPVTVQIGDIHLTGVQDVNGLAQAIKTRLPGQMMQEYFKN